MCVPFPANSIAALFRMGMHGVSAGTGPRSHATYHFTFTGAEQSQWTVVIDNQTIRVMPEHVDREISTFRPIAKPGWDRDRDKRNLGITAKSSRSRALKLLRAFALFPPDDPLA